MSRPGSTTSYSFDSNSFLTGINHKKSSNSNINQMIYTRDAVGNRTSIITSRGIANYGYDNENQLVSANNSEIGLNETFVYDSLGNRVSDNNGSSVYDAKKSRLLEDYKYLYTYDSNGNQISKTEKGLTGNFTQYEYSSENQLVKASKYVSNSLTMEANYKYDALGRRMQKIVSYPNDPTKSLIRKYAYDGEEILISYDESNNILATYTQSTLRTDDTLAVDITTVGKANKIAKEAGSFMFLKDALGSITDITDDSGNLIEHIAYSSFGKISKVTDATGADKISDRYFSIPYSYTNREYDSETDLYHYRARAYDASIGRFLQEDPHPGKVSHPKTLISKYIYTLNNPMNLTDPTGLFSIGKELGNFFSGSSGSYLSDVIAAGITFAVIYFSGGTALGALQAIGSAAGGAAAAAGASSAISGGDFDKNFHSFFRTSLAFLSLSALAAPGGVARAGGNGLQGYIESSNPYFGRGTGLTLGSSATFSQGSGFASHEFGHTLQFIGVAAFNTNPTKTFLTYLGAGLVGTIPFAGNPVETSATYLGGLL